MSINKFKKTETGDIPEGWNKSELDTYLKYIYLCLKQLYQYEYGLFENDLCERCITFRFAHFLQNIFDGIVGNDKYYVDCDYNSSFYYDESRSQWIKRNGKPIEDQKSGKLSKRFVDIIVHQRKYEQPSDLICFEIKKWNNCTKEGIHKDINNLEQLTSKYGYSFGFHLIFGQKIEKTKLRVVRGDQSFSINFAINNE